QAITRLAVITAVGSSASTDRLADSRAAVTGQAGHQTATVRGSGMSGGGPGEGTAGHPARAVRSSTGATGSYVPTPPPAAGSQRVLDRERGADPPPAAAAGRRRC